MDKDVVIKVENVSKKYCKSLKRSMLYGIKDITRNMFGLSSHSNILRPNEFWAVDDVSFEVKRGESVGLIGPNGSGKTTLLKMINGISWPDKGRISVRGRVGALIAVGAGFHPLLTGRENIYINAAILGMNKREVNKKFDSIVNFADIGSFLDSPVKHYSSGMYVRLGFSVAVHSKPEILLVDEVLAVGDRDFQIKCFQKIHELKNDENTSIILVSHNEYAMREYAQKCVVLKGGKSIFYGDSEDAISFYINTLLRERKERGVIEKGTGDKGLIKKVTFYDSSGRETSSVKTGGKLTVVFEYDFPRKIKEAIIGLNLSDSTGVYAAAFWNSLENGKLRDMDGCGHIKVTVDPCDLPIDIYRCSVVLCEQEESNVLEWKALRQRLIVERPNNTRGLLKLQQRWEDKDYENCLL